jgi:sulfate/thiosulfate transport system substrate-binding protein
MTNVPMLMLLACGAGPSDANERKLVVAAYTTPREVLAEHVLPAFQARWKAQTGQDVVFETSFQGSGAQSRAVAGGFEADVVWLSLAPDLDRLVDSGLVTHEWDSGPSEGIVSSSVAVIGVRPGNPMDIRDWTDLTAPGMQVLTPNVRTSGGAMWNVLAIVGSAERTGLDPEEVLGGVLRNVRVMDKGARESMLSFEKGVGDAIVTYENEVVVAKLAGRPMDYVVPPDTVVIENPAAVVDAYAERHGVRDVAEAFVAFLTEPEQQSAMAKYGLRPVVEGVPVDGLPPLGRTFRVSDVGGWEAARTDVFAEGALYDRAYASSREQR